MASALLDISERMSAAVAIAPTAPAISAASPRPRAASLSLFLSRRPAACAASTPATCAERSDSVWETLSRSCSERHCFPRIPNLGLSAQ